MQPELTEEAEKGQSSLLPSRSSQPREASGAGGVRAGARGPCLLTGHWTRVPQCVCGEGWGGRSRWRGSTGHIVWKSVQTWPLSEVTGVFV